MRNRDSVVVDSSFGVAESVKITCIDDDYVESRGLWAEHGWSMLIATPRSKVLVDIGQTWQVMKHNLSELDVDLSEIDAAVITHGHYDHAGGILGIMDKLPSKTRFFVHPKIFEPKYSSKPRLRYIGLPRQCLDDPDIRGRFNATSEPVKLADGIFTTGTIPLINSFESPGTAFKKRVGRELTRDLFEDEQAVLVNVRGKGIIVISGCANRGIVNALSHAQHMTGEKLYGLVGGFHLKGAKKSRIDSTIRELKIPNLSLIAPAHCTGFKASARLYQEFPSRFKLVSVGTELEFE